MNLIWFRNDLRIHSNVALNAAIMQGPCRAIFLATPAQWQQHDMAGCKQAFINRHVNELGVSLAGMGIELLVINCKNFAGQVSWLTAYCAQHAEATIFANEEIELNENKRDNTLKQLGLPLMLFESDVLVGKGKVLTANGQMFKVFSAFKKSWLAIAKQQNFVATLPRYISDSPTVYQSIEFIEKNHLAEKWPLASMVRSRLLPEFLLDKHQRYSEHRDYFAIKGTSGLSPYLAIGAIGIHEVVSLLLFYYPDVMQDDKHPQFSWLNELIWRDFYRHVLYQWPNLIKGVSFNTRYAGLPWRNDTQAFQAWCNGQTGYPIIDAAMRQLKRTGWMHNRLRMVVASFLTKHLLIDWRWGEQYFMRHLIDGDFSANNGGWQWAAGTGCDAQPYFRIFNPTVQSEKFDPNGEFIRMYVHELSDLPTKHLHFPHHYLKSNALSVDYPSPIVEHKAARLRALAFYKEHVSSQKRVTTIERL